MFIELPPYSAGPTDPHTTAEAIFDLNTLTLDTASRVDGTGRMRALARALREPEERLAIRGGAFELTYTRGA